MLERDSFTGPAAAIENIERETTTIGIAPTPPSGTCPGGVHAKSASRSAEEKNRRTPETSTRKTLHWDAGRPSRCRDKIDPAPGDIAFFGESIEHRKIL